MNELISVVTASYNYENFIKETIESVIRQTYQNWEMIIVDDGSSDNSVEVIKSYAQKDSRIKLFCHEGCENKGLKETVLLGIEKSSGKYVAFLESDDLWKENYLEEKVSVINNYPEAKVIFNDVEMFGDEKVIEDYDKYFSLNKKILLKKKYPANLFNAFSFQNLVPTFSCAMAEKEALLGVDFNSSVPAFLDHWIWAHIAYKNKFYYIDKKLTLWRMHSRSYIERKPQENKKNFMPALLNSLLQKGAKKNMFFWKRHKHPKIEKLFRGFFRLFV